MLEIGENLEGLIDAIGKYSFSEELVDSLNTDVTFTIFLFLGFITGYKQNFGDPIQCMAPAAFTHWDHYYNSYCYIKNKIIVTSFHETAFSNKLEVRKGEGIEQIVYYQYVPYIFFLQAILFRVPRIIWTTFARYFSYGEDIGGFVNDCSAIREKINPEERAEAVSKLAEFICRTMNLRSRKSLFGHSMAIFYIIRKCMAVGVVLGQFLLICYLIPSKFNIRWGVELLTYNWNTMEQYREGIDGAFPIVIRCDVDQMVPPLAKNETPVLSIQDASNVVIPVRMTCVLMQNFIVEKLFVFVYFWLIFMLVVNSVSALKKMLLVCPQHRYRMACQHLSNRERLSDAYKAATGVGLNSAQLELQRRQFIDHALRTDGILMFNFMRAQVGAFFTQDLSVELWKAYVTPAFRTANCISEQSLASVRISERRNSNAEAANEEEKTRLVPDTPMKPCKPSALPTEKYVYCETYA